MTTTCLVPTLNLINILTSSSPYSSFSSFFFSNSLAYLVFSVEVSAVADLVVESHDRYAVVMLDKRLKKSEEMRISAFPDLPPEVVP